MSPIPKTPPARLVVVPEDELQRMIATEVRKAIAEHAPRPASGGDDWISLDEAAAIVGVTPKYLLRLRGLKRHGSRRAPRYIRREVDAFVRERARAADDGSE